MVTTWTNYHKRPSKTVGVCATTCSQNYEWLGICCDWSYYHVCGFCSQNLDVPRKKHFASFCLQHLTTAFVHLVAKKSSCFNYNIQFVPCIVPYFILETSNGWTCPPPLPRPLQFPFRMAISWPPKCRRRKEKHMFGIQVNRTWVDGWTKVPQNRNQRSMLFGVRCIDSEQVCRKETARKIEREKERESDAPMLCHGLSLSFVREDLWVLWKHHMTWVQNLGHQTVKTRWLVLST